MDKLFSRIYEDNIIGKLSDERYSRMAKEYETEQKELVIKVAECENRLVELQKQTVDMNALSGASGIYRDKRTDAVSCEQAHRAH